MIILCFQKQWHLICFRNGPATFYSSLTALSVYVNQTLVTAGLIRALGGLAAPTISVGILYFLLFINFIFCFIFLFSLIYMKIT